MEPIKAAFRRWALQKVELEGDVLEIDHLADPSHLPFGDETFDGVLSLLVLHRVEFWEEALAEAARVLKPGGLFLGHDLIGGRIAHAEHPTLDELDLELSTLPFTAIWIRPYFGLFMRFKATKR